MSSNTHINFEMNRREFFGRFGLGLGGAALAQLFSSVSSSAISANSPRPNLTAPHWAPKAKRIIYLFMSGGLQAAA
jgi:hypothetical protein